ncbi:hypothetical protein EZS27_023853 [termite gut metagenome]|uniref:Uncharacterized protein n=1 Tax=termite gut metagenome TaxID=433724 RepID=A0A5J4R1B7_9ZZZZ
MFNMVGQGLPWLIFFNTLFYLSGLIPNFACEFFIFGND